MKRRQSPLRLACKTEPELGIVGGSTVTLMEGEHGILWIPALITNGQIPVAITSRMQQILPRPWRRGRRLRDLQ